MRLALVEYFLENEKEGRIKKSAVLNKWDLSDYAEVMDWRKFRNRPELRGPRNIIFWDLLFTRKSRGNLVNLF